MSEPEKTLEEKVVRDLFFFWYGWRRSCLIALLVVLAFFVFFLYAIYRFFQLWLTGKL